MMKNMCKFTQRRLLCLVLLVTGVDVTNNDFQVWLKDKEKNSLCVVGRLFELLLKSCNFKIF
ncbi:unnamed protein product [Paramecium pentaurelia]|uniref:Uncharacterized protein n=1 Tax=Paramecium pentaurelia TaxID=43138 RepID=A0A8S1YMT5_9CILI|nr:unnamed protein product [Paramecium pentaurelia]